MKDYKWMHS